MQRMLVGLLVVSCGGPQPAPHVEPVATPARTVERVSLEAGPFTLAVPRSWTSKPIHSAMRVLDLDVAPDTELRVYYFGPSGAGSIDNNLDRWASQFTQDGKPAERTIEHLVVAGQPATLLAIRGVLEDQVNPPVPDRAMIGAIVDSPSGPYYFKLLGPTRTVDATDHEFRALLLGAKLTPNPLLPYPE
jgi:hypothetical protein